MHNPKVSIVIPVYNGSNYLRQAIDSALGQTYKNIEVIVVNDGSDDDGKTEEICLSYGDNIRYFKKKNGGVASALNLGIKNITGDYFAWLSHDDLFAEDRMESDMEFLKNNIEFKACYCASVFIDENGKEIKKNFYKKDMVNNPYEAMQLGGLDMCGITINRICFTKTGLFNEINTTMQDVEFVLILTRYFKLAYNKKALFYKRIHRSMGTELLKMQHEIDQRNLFNRIGENFNIKAFFADIDLNDKRELGEKYVLLGELFSKYHSFYYADSFYKMAHNNQGGIFSYSFLLSTIGSENFHIRMNNYFMKRIMRKILRKIFTRK